MSMPPRPPPPRPPSASAALPAPGNSWPVKPSPRPSKLATGSMFGSGCFRAGASGYVLKVSPAAELIRAIAEVAEGRGYVTSLLAKDLITILLEAQGQPAGGTPLTPRQREVLQLIAEGRTMKEVASILKTCEAMVTVM